MLVEGNFGLYLALSINLVPPVYGCGSLLSSGGWHRRRILDSESGIGTGARNR
jgi:hypothetical protein